MTIAAIAGGADHVIAVDRDQQALDDTASNVACIHGGQSGDRLSLLRADWSVLRTAELVVTASSLLPSPRTVIDHPIYGRPELLTSISIDHDRVWRPLTDCSPAAVGLWRFRRARRRAERADKST